MSKVDKRVKKSRSAIEEYEIVKRVQLHPPSRSATSEELDTLIEYLIWVGRTETNSDIEN